MYTPYIYVTVLFNWVNLDEFGKVEDTVSIFSCINIPVNNHFILFKKKNKANDNNILY